ncbi:hypothetical protein [Streptomyces luteogriseus]|uniref:Vegetative cell wall protein gp1 n=1 Tax=Streptomyces luteogriseus TaxID=68233 RepID=A0A7W7DVE0_9ACTN|nr:hypothetical protein [Streptomyces luteogriseus]MBB4717699.1 hypothetical protein [Streptomyces luteogriseus]
MNAFLGELGRKLAERWVALLLLPGVLYVAVVTAASVLGQGRALDLRGLSAWVDGLAAARGAGQVGIVVLVAAGALAAATGAGLSAAALGEGVALLWAAEGRRGPGRWLAERRRERWRRAYAEVVAARRAVALSAVPPHGADPQARAALRASLDRCRRICPVPADRPTWIGDRLRAVDLRVHHAYRVDVEALWPRLWLALPDPARAELTDAHAAYRANARLTGWGLMYLLVALWWWPAAVVATVTLTTAWIRARGAAEALADLVEGAVDLYGRDVATALGVLPDGEGLDRASGDAVSALLRKDGALHPESTDTPAGPL